MKIKGIRILDTHDDVLTPILSDILMEISDGNSFYWSMLWVDGILNPNQGIPITEYEKKINHSENGLVIKWDELKNFSSKFIQIYDTIVIGCKDASLLKRYENENDMYTSCDIVIHLVDCSFWEIYSKNQNFIEKLAKKFNEIEMFEI